MKFHIENIEHMVRTHTPGQVSNMYGEVSLREMYKVVYGKEAHPSWDCKRLITKIFNYYGRI